MGIGARLLESTSDLAAFAGGPSDAASDSQPSPARTAPGQMLAAHGVMRGMQAELVGLRAKLEEFDGSMPTLRLDPAKVKASRWANRHETAYLTSSFASLKRSIEHSGGNTQPILIREASEGLHEVVFGHRRHRACLELGVPVFAVVWNGPMADVDLFLAMERENRERADLSPFEQGKSYLAALASGLFPSQRRLAESLGVSHTWVRKATMVAQLPPGIVECFKSPIAIQPKHAEKISAALDSDWEGVMKRADFMRSSPQRLAPSQVVAELIGARSSASIANPEAEMRVDDIRIGTAATGNGDRLLMEIDCQAVKRVSVDAAIEVIREQLSRVFAV